MRGSAVLLQIHSGQLAERRSPLPVTSIEPGVAILYGLEVSFWKKPLWILVFSLKEKETRKKCIYICIYTPVVHPGKFAL